MGHVGYCPPVNQPGDKHNRIATCREIGELRTKIDG